MMKKFLWIVPALLLAACSDDEGAPEKQFAGQVISFESPEHMMDVMTGNDVQLKDVVMSLYGMGDHTFTHVFCAKDYVVDPDNYDGPLFGTADDLIWFGSYYAFGFDAWAGFALSKTADKHVADATSKQQFSVWAESGAKGTDTFAVCYDMNSGMEGTGNEAYMADYGYPTIELTEPRIVDHLYIANSTWVYSYFKGEASDNLVVKITGWNGEIKTGEVAATLVAGKSKVKDWKKIDLKKLGSVDKVVFKAVTDDMMAPAYFCIDEIGLTNPAEN